MKGLKSLIKEYTKKWPIIHDFLFTIYHFWMKIYYFGLPEIADIISMINSFSQKQSDIYFIQIGANDGISNDPVFQIREQKKWRGILVEPQKKVFVNELQKNFSGNPNLRLENIAIDYSNGKKRLYKLSFCEERWAHGRATFDKRLLEESIDRGEIDRLARKNGVTVPSRKEDYITSEEVECMPFNDLLQKHKVNKLDILIIDVEGFDFEVIKMIDFEKTAPKAILYEYKHLCVEDFKSSINFLKKKDYKLFKNKDSDILAIQNKYSPLFGK